MPRYPPWRPSDSPDNSDSDEGYKHSRRRASPSPPRRSRRAASVSHGGRPLGLLNQRESYHRPSSETRYPSSSSSSSSSDNESDHSRRPRHRRPRNVESRRPRHRSHSPGSTEKKAGVAAAAGYRAASSQPRSVPRHHDDRRSDRHSNRDNDRDNDHDNDRHNNYYAGRRGISDRHDDGDGERPPLGRRRASSTEPRFHRHGDPNADRDDRDRRYPPSSSRSKTAYGGRDSGRDRDTDTDRGRNGSKTRSRSAHSNDNKPHRSNHEVLLTAGRTAFEAGAMAALKLSGDHSPLLGAKGAKIAAAALSAAAVDTFMAQKHPGAQGGMRHTMMRQATQLMIGNLVTRPAVNGIGKMRHVKK